jgi:cobalt-zinc-cadmium efflux system outer membrane protein
MNARFAPVVLGIALVVALAANLVAPQTAFAADQTRQRTRASAPIRPTSPRNEAAVDDTVTALLQGELTVERAVRVALLNNWTLLAEFEEIGISRAEFRQALLPRNPALEGEIRSGPGVASPGEIIVMQDVTSLLLIPIRRKAASAALRRASLRAASATIELAAETRTAFVSLQAAESVGALWDTTAASAQASADLARRQHEVGNVTDLDLENQQAMYEEAKIELARSHTEALVARERLNRAMGTWGEHAAWRIGPQLPALPESDGALEGLEAVAVERRPDLAAAQAEARAIAAQVPLARFSGFPDLRAGVHFEREPDGTYSTGPAVELAFPLFDRGQHAVTVTRGRLRQAEDRGQALATNIRSEVRVARERLVAARELVEYIDATVLPRRRRILAQTQLEFNGMLIGVFQLLKARQGEVGAQRDLISAQRDYWIARAELERAIGGPVASAQ